MLRPFPPKVGDSSPWGPIDSVTVLGPDAVAVTTGSHGGIRVSLSAWARFPEPVRATRYSRNGWFEEDCDWCLPYLILGLDAFEPNVERASELAAAAQATLERCHPEHVALVGALTATAVRHD
jgi:hypothetical protein